MKISILYREIRVLFQDPCGSYKDWNTKTTCETSNQIEGVILHRKPI